MKRVVNYFKSHIVTISYCAFFALALLPTIFSFFSRFGIFYKVGVLLLFLVFLAVYIYKHRIKINYRYLIIPLIIFAVFALYYFAVLPTYFTYATPGYSYIPGTSITIVTTFSMRLNSIVTIFNLCLFASLFLIISPSLGLKTNDIICFAVFIDAITLLACAYSLKQLNAEEMTSFLGNKNTFGQFLMVGIFISLLSFAITNKIYLKIIFPIIATIFFGFTLLSKSSTAILLSVMIIIVAVIFVIIDAKKIKLIWKFAIFIGFAVVAAIIFASPYIPFLANTKLASLVKDVYDKVLSFKGKSFIQIFTGRGAFWAFGGYIVRPEYIMLGYGSETLEEIVYRSTINYFSTRELVNAYLTVFNGYGIIGSLFYLGALVYIFYKYYQSKHVISEWLLLFFVVFLFYGMFESLILFESFSGSLLVTPILVVPAMCLKKEKKEVVQEVSMNE